MPDSLHEIAKQLVAPTKGIFAADWSLGSTEKHFAKAGIEHTEENRRRYREMLFTTVGLEKYISGVIFFEETLKQKTSDGVAFPELLEEKGIIPGIKVDKGTDNFGDGEVVTKGLDDLAQRLTDYKTHGAKFTKWRTVTTIGESIPTKECIDKNSQSQAEFAKLSQSAGLVPIVEPEVEMAGEHDIAASEEATRQTLTSLFSALERKGVDLRATILKTNYVHPGKDSGKKVNMREVTKLTLKVLERVLPPDLAGVVFLSGGDLPTESTEHLDLINKDSKIGSFTFSYARALQYPAITIWAGEDENKEQAQKAFLHRAKMNSLARQGIYNKDMEEVGNA